MSGLPPHTWMLYVQGPLMGAVRTTQRQKWVDPAYAKYRAYKAALRLLANRAGIPAELKRDSSYRVDIVTYWTERTRVDKDNIEKAVYDSLWRQDRRITDGSYHAEEFHGSEFMRVSIHESLNRHKAFIGRTKRRGELVHPHEVDGV